MSGFPAATHLHVPVDTPIPAVDKIIVDGGGSTHDIACKLQLLQSFKEESGP